MKAIETRYKGYRFRSRLEARWAVFFDKMGWNWKYEHQGYEVGWEDTIPWLPDFEIEIPFSDHIKAHIVQSFYVEVKGDPNFFSDGEWLGRFDFNGGPPGFFKSGSLPSDPRSRDNEVKRLLILGQIPMQQNGFLALPVVYHASGIFTEWGGIFSHQIGSLGPLGDFFCLPGTYQYKLKDFQPRILQTPNAIKRVMDALDAARGARFEHGETPSLSAR